jgi:hypothetical protein
MPTFLRGAFIAYMRTFGLPVPNVIVFQFNPETITHSFQQAGPRFAAASAGSSSKQSDTGGTNPQATSGAPPESFSFTLSLNADSDLPGISADPLAEETGIYSRLAALEMLLFPLDDSGSSGLLGSVSAALGGGKSQGASVPAAQVPTVIFVWGPGRIVPVRVSSLTITERLFDANLNPTYAEVQLQLTVLTPQELTNLGPNDPLAELASTAYNYTLGLKKHWPLPTSRTPRSRPSEYSPFRTPCSSPAADT